MQIRDNIRERRRERIQQLLGQYANEDAGGASGSPQRTQPNPQPIVQPFEKSHLQPPSPARQPSQPAPAPAMDKPSSAVVPLQQRTLSASTAGEPDPELWWKERQRSRKNVAGDWQGMKGLPQTSRAPERNATPPGSFDAPKFARGFTMRLAVAATAFAIVWIGLQLKLPGSAPVKSWLVSSVSADMDFKAIEAWYGETFGGSPSFFPFNRDDPDTKEVAAVLDAEETVSPVDGRVVETFAQTGGMVKVAASDGSEVRTVFAGRVQQVESESGGITILVQHPNRVLSVYGNLASASVKADDWVETGDKLGVLGAADGGEAVLQFAIQQNGKKLDPADVVPFD